MCRNVRNDSCGDYKSIIIQFLYIFTPLCGLHALPVIINEYNVPVYNPLITKHLSDSQMITVIRNEVKPFGNKDAIKTNSYYYY